MVNGEHTSRAVTASKLTAYEKKQIQAIAAWKSQKPGLGRRLLGKLSGQVSDWVGKALPADSLAPVMKVLNQMAERLARDDSILEDAWLREQGITQFQQLVSKPLEFADELAARIIADAGRIALGTGAATGAGGPISALAGVPLLLAGALGVIHKVSQAYGHNTETEEDKLLMLHILALSTAVDASERQQAMANYQRQIETSLIRQAIGDSTQSALQRVFLGTEIGSLIPGLGIVLNAQFNRSFVERAGETAQRVFQERWLRERGKVNWITPKR